MKTLIEQARHVMSEAEITLRRLIGDAAGQGDYDAIRRLSGIAERLVAFQHELREPIVMKRDAAVSAYRSKASPRDRSTREQVQKPAKGAYPRFQRCKGVLSRVGWSKKSKSEYEHKAPRQVCDQVVSALVTLAADPGGLVTADQILQELQRAAGAEVPQYQLYVVLALLTHVGLIEKRGRDGYRLKTATDFQAHAAQALDAVEEQS